MAAWTSNSLISPIGPHNDGAVITFLSVAPVLPVRHLAQAVARYERLGFAVQQFEGGDYAFAPGGRSTCEVVPVFVELEVAVPRLMPASR